MKKTILSIFLLFFSFASAFAIVNEGDKYVKFCGFDRAGNIDNSTCVSRYIILDSNVPVITLTANPDNSWTSGTKIVTATVTDNNLQTSKYALIDENATCDGTVTFSNDYVSGISLVFNNESFNGNKVCFEAKDGLYSIYQASNTIEGIDTIVPADPSITLVDQVGYNKIQFKGTCPNEDGLTLKVKDNGVEIHSEALGNPCSFDYTYTLTNPPLIHSIEYYIIDRAGNVTSTNSFTAHVPAINSGYLVTPGDNKEVGPIFTSVGFAGGSNLSVKIKDLTNGGYIAEGTTDSLGNFALQTPTSQALGVVSIDLEVEGVLVGDARNITIQSSNIKVPSIDNTTELEKSNTKLPTIEVSGEPLSNVQVYAKSATDDIIEIGRSDLDASGNASITSNVTLPGGDNTIYVLDTIHYVSSELLYITIIDPYGTCYDSVTRQTIPGCIVTVINCDTEATIVLPNLNGNPQDNPMTADANGYYSSYENVGNYCLKAEKVGYTWPSVIIASGTPNLDLTANVGSHGQLFSVIDDPIHIDIPMDIISNPVVSSGGGEGSKAYEIRNVLYDTEEVTSDSERKFTVAVSKGTKTLTKTYNYDFKGNFYRDYQYRFMFHQRDDEGNISDAVNKVIPLNKNVAISITDTRFLNNDIYIKHKESEGFKLFTDYQVNGKTVTFNIDKGFLLYIDLDNKLRDYRLSLEKTTDEELKDQAVEIKDELYPKYSVKFKEVETLPYFLFIREFETKYGSRIGKLSDSKILTLFPSVLKKIDDIEKKKELSNTYKYLYNYLGGMYNIRYGDYITTKLNQGD